MTKSTRYDGWHVQPNQQNAHMLESLVDLSKTMHQLVKMGITVIETKMGAIRPTIVIQATKEAEELKGVITKWRTNNGRSELIRLTKLNDCYIEWESKNVH